MIYPRVYHLRFVRTVLFNLSPEMISIELFYIQCSQRGLLLPEGVPLQEEREVQRDQVELRGQEMREKEANDMQS